MDTDTKKALKLLCFKASVRETGLELKCTRDFGQL